MASGARFVARRGAVPALVEVALANGIHRFLSGPRGGGWVSCPLWLYPYVLPPTIESGTPPCTAGANGVPAERRCCLACGPDQGRPRSFSYGLAERGIPLGTMGLPPPGKRVKPTPGGCRGGHSGRRVEGIMRVFRFALVVPVALGALALLSSPASAKHRTTSVPTQLSIGQVQLGPLGASVSVPLTFTCDPTSERRVRRCERHPGEWPQADAGYRFVHQRLPGCAVHRRAGDGHRAGERHRIVRLQAGQEGNRQR